MIMEGRSHCAGSPVLHPARADRAALTDRHRPPMNLRLRRTIVREFTRLSRPYTRISAGKAHREAREIAAWLNPRRGERVLDAACGPGTLARAIAARAARVAALDLCPAMLHAARQAHPNSLPVAHFTLADVEHLPYRAGSFDLVTCTYSFANFPAPLQVLEEFRRVTRRGGRIAVVDLLAPEDSAQCSYLNRLEVLRGRLYTRILRRSEFLDYFRQAGLRLESLLVRKRRRNLHDWLRQSPAAANPHRARQLRRLILESINGDKAGLCPRKLQRDVVFHHATGWFLLRSH